MDEQQITALVVAEVARSLTDLTERVERLERLTADRTHPAVAEAAAAVDDALVALARTTANLGDGGPPWAT